MHCMMLLDIKLQTLRKIICIIKEITKLFEIIICKFEKNYQN